MNYRVLRTDKANDQLHALIHYIADDSGSVDTALAYLEMLEHSINLLSTSPSMGSYPRYATLRRQGYRVLIVQRHLIFYKVEDNARQIIIYAIFDAKQEYKNLL